MTLLWIISVFLTNVSIVDPFWGMGFVLVGAVYFYYTPGIETRKLILISLVIIWGLRLSLYLAWRNMGKGEDFRYQQFRRDFGPGRYWWVSFFQTFLLQGILMWLISAPLLAAQYDSPGSNLNPFDIFAIFLWVLGFVFEAGSDLQLALFKRDPANRGKLLTSGLWKYTRHPNYFGDATVWWGFAMFAVAGGFYLPILSALLMTALIIKVSGVSLLEKTLIDKKPDYAEYIRNTSAFFPWFPKKR